MKKLLFTLVFVLVFAFGVSTVFAADVSLEWDPAEGATSYKIEMSTDLGLTWAEERNAGSETTLVWIDAPDTGLLLFRAVACNNAGEAIRTWSGAFYNGDWKLPDSPGGTGIE